MNELEIGLYEDGFKGDSISCIHYNVAAASGYFNHDNYFYYCFIYAIYNNWRYGEFSSIGWIDQNKQFLKKLNLELTELIVVDRDSLIDMIKMELEKKHPIILNVTYSSIPWNSNYMENDGCHGYIVTGYHPRKPLFIIREDLLLDHSNFGYVQKYLAPIFKGNVFWKFQITDDILYNMWYYSNIVHKNQHEVFYNKIFSICKSEHTENHSQFNPIQYLYSSISYDDNNNYLIWLLNNYGLLYKNNELIDYDIPYIRLKLIGSLKIIFEVLFKYIDKYSFDYKYKKKLNVISQEYTSTRNNFVAKFHRDILKKGFFSSEDTLDAISKECELGKQLSLFSYDLMNAFYEHMGRH